jgi:L-threonylcarbamoyladenylate synthase
MLPAGIELAIEEAVVFRWGSWAVPEEMARELYAGLRALDAEGCEVIICPLPPGDGIGAAIRDRLLKAGNRE